MHTRLLLIAIGLAACGGDDDSGEVAAARCDGDGPSGFPALGGECGAHFVGDIGWEASPPVHHDLVSAGGVYPHRCICTECPVGDDPWALRDSYEVVFDLVAYDEEGEWPVSDRLIFLLPTLEPGTYGDFDGVEIYEHQFDPSGESYTWLDSVTGSGTVTIEGNDGDRIWGTVDAEPGMVTGSYVIDGTIYYTYAYDYIRDARFSARIEPERLPSPDNAFFLTPPSCEP